MADSEADSDDGGVAGFFHEGNDYWAMSPCLNDLIGRYWIMV